MRDAGFTALYGVLATLALGRPWIGLMLWVWMDYMNPHRLCYGYAKYLIPFSAMAAGVTAISYFLVPDRGKFAWSRETILMMLFVLWMNVTVIFALNPHDAWQEWDRTMKIQILIFATLAIANDRFKLHALLWTIVVSLGVYGVKGGIFAITSGGQHKIYGPEYTFIEDNNDLALALAVTIPLMRYLQLTSESTKIRWCLGIAMALTTLSVCTSYSRGGFLGLVTVTLLMLMKSRKRVTLGIFLVILIVGLVKFMPQQWFDRIGSITQYKSDGSALGRINAWKFAMNLTADHPLTGGGFRVFTKPLFRQYAPDPEDHHEAHNIFFKILAEHGYPGLFLFVTIAVLAWRTASWTMRFSRGDPQIEWAGDLSAMVQVSLAGYAVGGSFLNLAYFDLPYHLVAIIVLAKVIAIRETRETVIEDEAEQALQPVTA